jgi:hypothetical protein
MELTRGGQPGYAIHVREKAILNVHQEAAYILARRQGVKIRELV